MVRKRIRNKAFFFSIDALIAVILTLFVLVMAPVFYIKEEQTTQPVYFSSDIIQLMSTIKLSDINQTAVKTLLNNSNVTNLNRTILEQLLRFRVDTKYGSESKRKKIAEELLNLTISGLIPDYYNMGVWIENYDDPIYATSQEPVTQLISSKQMVSGIEKEQPIEGVASRVLLSNINERTSSAYTYFGGYEGDGNITKIISLPDIIQSIDSAYMELGVGSNFSLYINDELSGNYNASNNTGVGKWEIDSQYLDNFQAGENNIKLSFNGTKKYVAGGYIRVRYSTSALEPYKDTGISRYYFPGINGLINLYSSFYIPGPINTMNISLHVNSSNATLFLIIGNTLVFNGSSMGDKNILINNTNLSSLLDYSTLNQTTVPIRFGLYNATPVLSTQPHIFSVSDISGNTAASDRLNNITAANRAFTEVLLDLPYTQVGLVGYQSDADDENYNHDLSRDFDSLNTTISGWAGNEGDCTCCGILKAIDKFSTQSDPSAYKFMVVVGDGKPAVDCGELGTVGDLNGDGTPDKKDDRLVKAACNAYENYSIHVHVVGIEGPPSPDENTLRSMAECGNGTFYYSTESDLVDVYKQIAQDIIEAAFKKQTVTVEENITTVLYPDSYIEFNYTSPAKSYEHGRIPVTIESPRFGNNITNGTFYVPDTAVVYDAKLTSYSGDTWTSNASIKDSSGSYVPFYDLSDYGAQFYLLGDPYIVNIPSGLIQPGENTVRINTGFSPINSTGGSPDDRVIYTIGLDLDINYTGIFAKAEGCIWTNVAFEDGTVKDIIIPASYPETAECTFPPPSSSCNEFDDAINNAVCHLFKQLDFDNNGKLFVKFGPGDLDIETYSTGKKIPYMWGPTIVEVRVWK